MRKFFEVVGGIIGMMWEFTQKFPLLCALIGLLLAGVGAKEIVEEFHKKEQVIAMWEEQLPAGHWVKDDPFGVFIPFLQNMGGIVTTGFDLTTLSMGQTGDFGSIMENMMEVEKSVWRGQYTLKNASTEKKVWRTIKMEPGESVNLEFYREDILQEFDINEKEFLDKGNLLALSCVDDTEIATIRDGKLTAHNNGKTTLYIYCDGEIWEYTVKVK